MDSLPAELVDVVLHGAKSDTLLNLRLTCRTLCRHVSPSVFQKIDVWLERRSLKKLVNIANSPHLRNLVDYVCCGMEEFYTIDFESFKRGIYDGVDDNDDEAEAGRLRASYRKYRQYTRQQKIMEDTGYDLGMMTTAFTSLTALKSVAITDHSHYFADYCKGPKFLDREPLIGPGMLTPCYIMTPRGKRQLRIVLSALARARRGLQDFSIRISSAFIGSSGSLISPLNSTEQGLAQDAFANLKVLHLKLPRLDVSSYAKEYTQVLSTATILQAAKKLESLSLDLLDINDSDPELGSTWNDLFGTNKIGHLQKLVVKGLIIRETDLINFLLESCTELRDLSLDHARLIEGSWGPVFENVRKLQSLEGVELIRLRYNWGDENKWFVDMLDNQQYKQPLYDYLCKRTDMDPWPEMVKRQMEMKDEEDREDQEYERAVKQERKKARRDRRDRRYRAMTAAYQ
ncbi:hypothetical protein MMC28_004881 [Mycoblastus sanguinarius]|nr:hypothetical protein [Mycoblastus sanguinarius]